METESKRKLPPIFKMSMICNILPYYGHLHRWRRLLEKLSTKTKKIWEQNCEQLAFIGKDYKREIDINSKKQMKDKNKAKTSIRSWLNLFLLSVNSVGSMENTDFLFYLNNIEEDEALIFDPHTDLFKVYRIHFCKKNNIHSILPAFLCPYFKPEIKKLKKSKIYKLDKLVQNEFYTKSFVIEKRNENIFAYSVISSTLNLFREDTSYSNFQILFYDNKNQLCDIKDCVCKPKKLRACDIGYFDLFNIVKRINEIPSIEDVQVCFNDNCLNNKGYL